ncbi:MAG: DUF3392 domain-containing protein [Thiomicrospira sp.]|uniref:DUF3392 domain-containing protein n=1 Tax=Thiomicrospira sp. TaxID=935 RepID=UPI0019D9E7B9|nr:DUF3392 domain-containing protein [Thiomicrospira sp.]MBE0492870.1 DUF3392 domain-containing protein [Thiomicrospira sp.]
MDTNFLTDFLVMISSWVRPYLSEIGFAMMATLLVIYGNDITAVLKKQIGGLQFFVRLTVFILFCALGFALLANYLTPMFIDLLASTGDVWLGVAVIGAFYVIGLLAQRRGAI